MLGELLNNLERKDKLLVQGAGKTTTLSKSHRDIQTENWELSLGNSNHIMPPVFNSGNRQIKWQEQAFVILPTPSPMKTLQAYSNFQLRVSYVRAGFPVFGTAEELRTALSGSYQLTNCSLQHTWL